MKIDTGLIGPAYEQSVVEILDANLLCTISSIGDSGAPHSKTAYFASSSQLFLFILTQPNTRHGRNVTADPRVSMTIFDSSQPWGQPHKGIQARGLCHQVDDSKIEEAFACYAAKHPALLELAPSSDALLRDLESRFFRVVVEEIRVIDEARFGEETHFDIVVTRNPGEDIPT